MQKKLIALAIAGLSSAAFAQSNVTIYGAMDATYDNVKANGATAAGGAQYASRGRTTMNSSFIGFKGSEDLGNGLKVVFQIEQGVGENAGATNTMAGSTYGLANRDTYVGISGGFGTVVAGNLTGPARWLGAQMDVNNGATGIGANTALIGKFGGGVGAGYFDNRFANAIAYLSPSFGGFSGVLAFVPNENKGTHTSAGATEATNTAGWTAKLLYNQGPIMAAYAYTKLKDKGTAGLGPLNTGLGGVAIKDATDNRIGVRYDFGMGTVGFLWDHVKADATVGVDAKQSVWYLPVTFNAGGGKVLFQYGHAANLKGSANAAGLDYRANHWELGYEYALSKRTIVKALYSSITNKDAAGYDFLYGVSAPNSTASGAAIAAGNDPRGFSVGLRHSF